MKYLIFSVLFNLLALSTSYATESLTFNKAWIPETPPGARVMAGFMEIHNPGQKPIDITAVSSPAFKSVEMHLSKEVDGIAKMLPQKSLTIRAKDTLILKPGGYHLMLIKPFNRLMDGQQAQLTFTLSNGETQKLDIGIKKSTTGKMSGMKCGAGKCGGGKCGGGK